MIKILKRKKLNESTKSNKFRKLFEDDAALAPQAEAPAQQPAANQTPALPAVSQAPTQQPNANNQNQQNEKIDVQKSVEATNALIMQVANGIKQLCSVEALTKSIPQIKLAKDAKVADVSKIESATKATQVEIKDVLSAQATIKAFGDLCAALGEFNKTLAEKAPQAPENGQLPAQPGAQLPAQQGAQLPAQPAQSAAQPQTQQPNA